MMALTRMGSAVANNLGEAMGKCFHAHNPQASSPAVLQPAGLIARSIDNKGALMFHL
jgi:hypothetical protein